MDGYIIRLQSEEEKNRLLFALNIARNRCAPANVPRIENLTERIQDEINKN